MFRVHQAAWVLGMGLLLGGCATETSRTVDVQQTRAATTAYAGPRVPVSVGKFDNRSSFMRGVFSDGVDRLGSQAKTTLISHLQQSQRFNVMDRDNLAETGQEAKLQGVRQQLRGASYVVTGDVTEFGRKEVGDTSSSASWGGASSRWPTPRSPSTWSTAAPPRWCIPLVARASTNCPTARCWALAVRRAMTPRSTARCWIWPFVRP